jgi:hypothetical protein
VDISFLSAGVSSAADEEASTGTASTSAKQNVTCADADDTQNVVGVELTAAKPSCVTPVVELIDSDSEAGNAKVATAGKDRGCGSIILDSSDDLMFNPGLEFSDADCLFSPLSTPNPLKKILDNRTFSIQTKATLL